MATKTTRATLLEHAGPYLARGWVLVPVRDKKPLGDNWNEAGARDANALRKRLDMYPSANGIGVLLAESRLCSFDPDDLQRTSAGLRNLGIDVEQVLDSGWRIRSGKPNSGRALFALPQGETLRWMRLRVRRPRADWVNDKPTFDILFELRASSPNLQDVLPPSRHPAGTNYSAPPLPKAMPKLTGPLLALWRRWQADPRTVEQQLYKAFGVPPEDQAPMLNNDPKKLDYPSSAREPFNKTTTVESILARHGYTQHDGGRWAHPGATGSPGCRAIPEKDDLWHSDNGGDPLCGTFDAWTAHVVLDHKGDPRAAERAWYAEHPEFDEILEDDTEAPTGDKPRFALRKASEIMAKQDKVRYKTVLGAALPVGVVMLTGIGGTGKSTLAATWAAHVSNGEPCPPWEPLHARRARVCVLWLSTEENRNAIVLPRHEALGGDMARLLVPEIAVQRGDDGTVLATDFDIERDLRPLLVDARRDGTPVRLVVCDALPALVQWGKQRSANSDTDVKRLLGKLSSIAQEFDCCILGIAHWNKKTDLDDEFRTAGAQAWRESPRLSFACVQGFIYATKANDFGELGVDYTQEVVRVLDRIPAMVEGANAIAVTARRAAFGPELKPKAKIRELIELAKIGRGEERKPPSRLDRMVEVVKDRVLWLVEGPDGIDAGLMWRMLAKEYGSEPNGAEKKRIVEALGLALEREGSRHMLRRP
jgi:hypothetical protein